MRVPLSDLLVDATSTYLSVDTPSGTTALYLKNTYGFGPGGTTQFLLVGEVGNQGSEIVKTTVSSGNTTVYLAAALTYPHSADTPVAIIGFDQVEITNAPTVDGTKTQISGSPFTLAANNETTNANDIGSTTGYYFARFKKSTIAQYSAYSDPAPYSGYTIYSARTIIEKALNGINKDTSSVLTDEFAFQQLDNFQEEVLREQKRWSFMESFNYLVGRMSAGSWRIAVPTDMDDQYTNKSVYNARFGKLPDLTFVDKEKWDEITSNIAHSTLSADIIVGQTTVALASSADFDDGGNIQVGSETIPYTANNRSTGTLFLTDLGDETVQNGDFNGSATSWTLGANWTYNENNVVHATGSTAALSQDIGLANGTDYQVTLTIGGSAGTVNITLGDGGASNSYDAGTGEITFISTASVSSSDSIFITPSSDFDGTIGAVSVKEVESGTKHEASSGADAFQGASFGMPTYWTIWEGYIYVYPFVGPDFTNRNLYLDYYKAQTMITKDSDLIVIPDSTCAQYYLEWKFLKKLNNGSDTPESNSALAMYVARREKVKQKNSIGRTFRLKPMINSLNMNAGSGDDPRWIRDGAFPNTDFGP